MKVKVLMTQSCMILCDPMGCSLPRDSVHGNLQAKILEWVAIPFSRVSSKPWIEPGSLASQVDSLLSEPLGKLIMICSYFYRWSTVLRHSGLFQHFFCFLLMFGFFFFSYSHSKIFFSSAMHIQPWILLGRTDSEIEVPILWPPDAKSWLIGKDSDTGKDWKQEEKGTSENEMVWWHPDSMDMSLNKLLGMVKDREVWHAAVHGISKSCIGLGNWTETTIAMSSLQIILSKAYLLQCLHQHYSNKDNVLLVIE